MRPSPSLPLSLSAAHLLLSVVLPEHSSSASRRERRGHWTSAARVPRLGFPFNATKWAQPLPGISHRTHTEDSSLEFLANPCFPPMQVQGERGPRPSISREGHPGDGHRRAAETSNNSLEAALPSDGCAWPSGRAPESQASRAARAKEGIWVQLALHKPRKKYGIWAGEMTQSVKSLPSPESIPNTKARQAFQCPGQTV